MIKIPVFTKYIILF